MIFCALALIEAVVELACDMDEAGSGFEMRDPK
jgi:hypothetical protein